MRYYLVTIQRDGKRLRRTFKTIEGFDRCLVEAEWDRLDIVDYGSKNEFGEWVSEKVSR